MEFQKQKDLKELKFKEVETDKKFKKVVKISQETNAVYSVREFYLNWDLSISHFYFEDELIHILVKNYLVLKF